MIYSRSSEYAIRATIHLAQVAPGQCAMVKDIARAEDIPSHFLAKILQDLARKGFLRSTKGPSGGFCLRQKANDVRLIDIVDAVDGLSHYQDCIAGFPQCNEQMGCPMHTGWVALHGRIMEYLKRNTIGSLVKQLDTKKRAAASVKVAAKAKVTAKVKAKTKKARESKKDLRSSQ